MDFRPSVLSNHLADAVAAAAPSVVQVQGRRRPASGIVYGPNVVVTTVQALGRDDHLRVRSGEAEAVEAELAGWDPASGVAVLRVPQLDAPPLALAETPARVGHLALAVARSWSNVVTASAGIVSVIGGPLPTGRHRAIEQVIRTTAPMHDGFAGGAFLDTNGRLLGLTTAAAIRGLGVVIPTAIVWKSSADILEHGGLKRGYLGLAGQGVELPGHQRSGSNRDRALLVVAVTSGSPAEAAGLLVGDLMIEFDSKPIDSPEDLLGLLVGERVGRDVPVRVLRGASSVDLTVRVGERRR
jgi:S1-C subfamily serine protease